MASQEIPRPEHPRPQYERERWLCLNGEWDFALDPGDSGIFRGWAFEEGRGPSAFDRQILVPFCPESRLSGIGNTDFMPVVWYRRRFTVPDGWEGARVRLHFGAVDWSCRVWVNGQELGQHRGGSSPFFFDATDALHADRSRENAIVVRVYDDLRTGLQPAGKQSPIHQSFAASYTRTTGIWQTVWLEAVPAACIESVQILPDLEGGRLVLVPRFGDLRAPHAFRATLSSAGHELAAATVAASDGVPLVIDVPSPRPWSPADPHLYDLRLELLRGGEAIDRVASYAGLRDFRVEGDRFLLNGEPIFLRLVLDQGFYPDGVWTAPTDDALRADIERAQDCGFNGARLHQKVFEERFHTWADRLGYLTWGEFCDWGIAGLGFRPPRHDARQQERALDNHLREWCDVVVRDRNHPSIVTWTPFNEAHRREGRTRLYDRALHKVYRVTKALDPTRPVHDASGWSHVVTDVYSVHDYEQDPAAFRARYAEGPEKSPRREPEASLPATTWSGQPYVVDEYGGTWWHEGAEAGVSGDPARSESWGYGDRPRSAEQALARIEALTAPLLENPWIAGFCYTQLTDIEQEQNGLYTYEREPKFDLARLRAAFTAPAAIEKRERSPEG